MIDNEIPHETLGNIIIEAINTIRGIKKIRSNSTFGYLNKKLHNSNSSTLIDTRLSNLIIDGKLKIKNPLGKHPTGLKTITHWNLANLKHHHHLNKI